jgi:dihydropteroate synthase
LLIGVSRKSFIGKLLGVETAHRMPAGLACAVLGLGSGAALVRTHDVAETVQALRMAEAIQGQRERKDF